MSRECVGALTGCAIVVIQVQPALETPAELQGIPEGFVTLGCGK